MIIFSYFFVFFLLFLIAKYLLRIKIEDLKEIDNVLVMLLLFLFFFIYPIIVIIYDILTGIRLFPLNIFW